MIPDYLSIENAKHKELILTYYLAPVMLKVKPASLLAFSSMDLREYDALVQAVGIDTVILDEYHNKSYVLFYRENSLKHLLEMEKNQQFLALFGYKEYELAHVLYRLEVAIQQCHRLNRKEVFPHEIGLLLGYPLEDVIGYIKNQGQQALENGYWKVYGDVKRAKDMFQQYDQAKKTLLDYVSNHSLLEYHFG